MTNYDFLTLSPYEFEGLTRDLLQAHLNVHLESFGHGADNGIDLRYSKGGGFVVQCKRYSEYNSLLTTLKKEVVAVKRLRPKRYLIVTSVSMLPDRKEIIKKLFAPFILSSDDIYGREDLNNLLQKNPNIERNHFKLWLSSTNILQTIVNRQVVNQSNFSLEEIKSKLQIYVQNSSFTEASSILESNRYLVISGIPGIGKTTLAEMLVYDILAEGYDDFIYLSDSINEGYKTFEETRSQVFLFDDFLGSNFLEKGLGTNEEKQIIRFIKKIKGSKNKLLIFTTREYILNQAKLKFEDFDREEFVKCIIDLTKYTTHVKARILYNHLFFNGIPYPFIESLIKKNYLLKIIEHKNYSPRIIEYISNTKLWNKSTVDSFPELMLNLFQSPYKVWQHAFESQISLEAKLILYALLVTGPDTSVNDLFKQVKQLNQNQNGTSLLINFSNYKRALRELDNSFIHHSRSSHGQILITFHNPSIQDFLIDHTNSNDIFKEELIRNFIFLKPSLKIFNAGTHAKDEKRFTLTPYLKTLLVKRILSNWDRLEYSSSLPIGKISNDDLTALKLSEIDHNLLDENLELKEFVITSFRKIIYSENIGDNGVHAFNQLLFNYFTDELNLDVQRILLNIVPSLWREEDLNILHDFENYFREAYNNFKDEHYDIYQEIFEGVLDEIAYINTDDKNELERKIDELKEFERRYDVEAYNQKKKIQDKVEEIERQERDEMWRYFHEGDNDNIPHRFENRYKYDLRELHQKYTNSVNANTEKEEIENLFRSMNK